MTEKEMSEFLFDLLKLGVQAKVLGGIEHAYEMVEERMISMATLLKIKSQAVELRELGVEAITTMGDSGYIKVERKEKDVQGDS